MQATEDLLRETLVRSTRLDEAKPAIPAVELLLSVMDDRGRQLAAALATSRRWPLPMVGQLELARRSESGRMTTELLRRIEDPWQRSAVLIRAHDLELAGIEELQRVLQWDDAGEPVILAAAARLARAGEEFDVAVLEALTMDDRSPEIRAFALVILEEAGADEQGAERAWSVVEAVLDEPRGEAVAIGTVGAVATHKLPAGAAFLKQSLEAAFERQGDGAQALALESLRVLMLLEPSAATEAWLERYERASYMERLRLALVAMNAWEQAESAVFERLAREDDETLALIGRAATIAREVGTLTAEEVVTLRGALKSTHGPTAVWARSAVGAMDPARRRPALESVLAVAAEGRRASQPVSEAVFAATRLLAADAIGTLTNPIYKAAERRDEPMLEAVLAGIERADLSWSAADAEGGVALPWDVNDPPAWSSRSIEALAVLIEAKAGLVPQEGERLERLVWGATGSSGWTRALRAQAAWLALEAMGEGESGLADAVAAARMGG